MLVRSPIRLVLGGLLSALLLSCSQREPGEMRGAWVIGGPDTFYPDDGGEPWRGESVAWIDANHLSDAYCVAVFGGLEPAPSEVDYSGRWLAVTKVKKAVPFDPKRCALPVQKYVVAHLPHIEGGEVWIANANGEGSAPGWYLGPRAFFAASRDVYQHDCFEVLGVVLPEGRYGHLGQQRRMLYVTEAAKIGSVKILDDQSWSCADALRANGKPSLKPVPSGIFDTFDVN